MVTALFPSNKLSMSSSTSTCNSKPSTASTPGIKLAPLIRQANVVSFEQRQGKIWYIIQVTPQQLQHLPPTLERHPYTISRRYDDCVQFCQRLYDAFPCLSFNNKGRTPTHQQQHQQHHHYSYDLPKLKSQGILNKKQPNGQRRAELDRFVQTLFRLPAAITQTLIVLEFFGLQKGDMEQQVLREKQNMVRQQQALITTFHHPGGANNNNNDDGYSFFDDPFQTMILPEDAITSTTTNIGSSKWSAKFRTFRGRTSSSSSLSSFCSQAAHRLPWSSNTSSTTTTTTDLLSQKKKPSFTATTLPTLTSSSNSSSASSNSVSTTSQLSPPPSQHHPHYYHYHHLQYATLSDVGRQQQQRSSVRTSHCSNQSGLTTMSTSSTSTSSHPTMALSAIGSSSVPHGSSSVVRTMKLKVIYDVDNIVVIQIPRSTNLAALRTRLHDKFSTMLDRSLLADQFILLYNENTRSSSSSGFSLDQVQLSSSSSDSSSSVLVDASTALPSSPSITLISTEEHWSKAMKSWDSFEKVTLRCIY